MAPQNWSVGQILVGLGIGLFLLGGAWLVLERFGISLGRLPGDLHWEGKRGSFHFPIVTCLVLSAVGTLLLRLFSRH